MSLEALVNDWKLLSSLQAKPREIPADNAHDNAAFQMLKYLSAARARLMPGAMLDVATARRYLLSATALAAALGMVPLADLIGLLQRLNDDSGSGAAH